MSDHYSRERRLQAERNLELSKFLLEDDKYYDWVITTAFYSALHFALSAIFPLEDGKNRYATFNNYLITCQELQRFGAQKDKHRITSKLINIYLPDAQTHYRWLKDRCWEARYESHKVNKETATLALKKANTIKDIL
jgi:uncharacterized protein (UPF0332 family)